MSLSHMTFLMTLSGFLYKKQRARMVRLLFSRSTGSPSQCDAFLAELATVATQALAPAPTNMTQDGRRDGAGPRETLVRVLAPSLRRDSWRSSSEPRQSAQGTMQPSAIPVAATESRPSPLETMWLLPDRGKAMGRRDSATMSLCGSTRAIFVFNGL